MDTLMKILIAAIVMSSLGAFAHASTNGQGTHLCPRYYCVAESTGMNYMHQHPGFGYGDEIETAKLDALKSCQQESGPCVVSNCIKNTGPVLRFSCACQSQW